MKRLITFLMFFLVVAANVFAAPGRTTYQAKIIKPDGYPLEANNVSFQFSILDPTGTCVLYVESYAAVNMANSGGLISFALGAGTKTFPASSTAISSIFDNSTVSYSCQSPGIYNPVSSDIRKIVMQFNDGTGWQTLPAMSINAVPYAMYAGKSEDSILFNGKADSAFVQYSTMPTCTASQALHFNGATFSCITAGGGGGASYTVTSSDVTSALGYTPANPATLSSSFTTTASFSTVTATVNSLGTSVTAVTSTVGDLSASLTNLTAAVSAITSSQWNTSGTTINYTAGNVGIGTDTPIGKLHIADNVATNIILDGYLNTIGAPGLATRKARGTAASPTAVLANDYLGTFGARGYGTTGFSPATRGMIGIKANENWTDTAQGTAISFETTANSGTTRLERMRITDTGDVGIGTTAPAYTLDVSGTVNAKSLKINGVDIVSSVTSSSVISALGYTPANDAVSGSYVVKANNLSDLASATVARSNLGLGDLAVLNFMDLSSSQASGTLAAARLPAFSGDISSTLGSSVLTLASVGSGISSGTQYTKVTVDGKGRVISGAQLSASDVTTALGYTPQSSGSVVSSQWTTAAASAIYYNSGNVGIGTAAPTQALEVSGITRISKGLFVGNAPSGWSGEPLVVNGSSARGSLTLLHSMVGQSQATNGLDLSLVFGNAELNLRESGYLRFMTANTERLRIDATGNIGLGITAPTAKLHLVSGTASTAPLKFTSGTLVTSPQSGTIEYDGSNYYVTDGSGVRRVIATASTPGSLNDVSTVSSTGNLTLWPANGSSVIVSATTASTNSQTGALVVKGGLGVVGTANIGGNLNVSGTIHTSSYFSAASLMYLYGTGAAYTNATDAYAAGERGFTADLGGSTAWDLLKLQNASGTQFIVEGGGYTGIGTADPDRRLTIIGDGTAYGDDVMIEATNNNSAGTFAQINLAKSRGTSASRTTVLAGDTLGALAFRGQNASSLGYGAIIRSIAESDYSTAQSADLRFQTTASATTADRMIINSSGNVGIGLSSPTARLHVAGNSAATAISLVSSTMILQNTNATAGALNALMFSNYDGFGNAAISTAQNTAGNVGNSLVLQTKTSSGGAWNADQLVLNPNGNVGIGTSSPVAKLQVAIPDNNAVYFGQNDGVNSNFRFLNKYTDGYNFIQVGVSSTDTTAKLKFSRMGSSSNLADIRFLSDYASFNGNLGVGTTSATHRLHLNTGNQSMKFDGFSAGNSFTSQLSGSDFGSFIEGPDNGQFVVALRDNDVNDGFRILSGGGNYMADSVYDTPVFTALATGNVGIGTSSPIDILQVESSATTVLGVNTTGTAATARSLVSFDRAGAQRWDIGVNVNQLGTNDLHFRATQGLNYLMTLTTSGNVGIGTIAPSAMLDVASGAVRSTRNGYPNVQYAEIYGGDNVQTAPYLRANSDEGNKKPLFLQSFHDSSGGPAGNLGFYFQIGVASAPTDVVAIRETGLVGIGTTAPFEKLHVDASTSGRIAVASGNIFATSGYGLSLESDTDDGAGYLNLHTASQGASVAEFQIRGGHGPSETAATRTIMSFKTNTGRVAVGGIATPAAQLHIGKQEAAAGTSGSVTRLAIQPYGHTGGPWTVTARDIPGNAFLDYYYGAGHIMTFENGGDVGIGVSAPTQKLHVNGNVQVAGDIYGGLYGGTRGIWRFSTTDPNFGIFYTEGSPDRISFSPQGGGSATPTLSVYGSSVGIGVTAPTYQLQLSTDSAAKPGTSTWTIASDRRLKDVRAPFTRGLAAIENIQPIYFSYKKDNPVGLPSDKEYVGIIAQEIQKNIPEATQRDKDGYLRVTNDSIIWTMFNAIKELYQKWNSDSQALHEKVSNLEEENKALKAYLCQKDPEAAFCKPKSE
ncbi:tail fiber domain-containing protein [Pseudobdellovibrio sp. HCB154]|uniref:tail fiber domain-containing protein n=1 Tax=Pseudobdellovibrio sp. HCB154 TaxID=3386277 RepID=UPI0039173093